MNGNIYDCSYTLMKKMKKQQTIVMLSSSTPQKSPHTVF
ncbi:hypothetical protein SACS_0403 [Parasaccharibacter apium]|uniref:Uncharacterized protein n=1 Tax=Parasaccharibacter apium TaxID=1510841 RepID=A0A7U7J0G4_9PROT|nr:hypothetical protein SACS_0403 [Parasaccharibacter apium]